MNNADKLRGMPTNELHDWIRRNISASPPTPEIIKTIRETTDNTRLASFISAGAHCADYEDDDYDPEIYNWLMREDA